jgi:hypothetical protein
MTTPDEDYGVSQSTQWRLDSMVEDSRMSVEDTLLEWLSYKNGYSDASKEKKDAFGECMEVIQYIKVAKRDYIEGKNEKNKSIIRDCINEGYSEIAILDDYLNSMIKHGEGYKGYETRHRIYKDVSDIIRLIQITKKEMADAGKNRNG